MRSNVLRLSAAAALAAALWIVPSAVTQGQGTLGDRFAHADRALIGGAAVGRSALATGDSVSALAVEGL